MMSIVTFKDNQAKSVALAAGLIRWTGRCTVSGLEDDDGNPVQPCEGAVLEKAVEVERRTTDDPTKIPCYANDPGEARRMWFGKGRNHRVEDGWIARDVEVDAWFLSVDSMEQLAGLLAKHGRLTLRTSGLKSGEPLLVLGFGD